MKLFLTTILLLKANGRNGERHLAGGLFPANNELGSEPVPISSVRCYQHHGPVTSTTAYAEPPVSLDQWVNGFDTEKFADQVKETGAGYVMFTMMQRTR